MRKCGRNCPILKSRTCGDTYFPLLLDATCKNMVTQANFNHLMRGGIWVEMIFQHPEVSSQMNPSKEVNVTDLTGD